ncbi:TorF family putative porin [Herbaspirillum sp. RTI4]|uniref:TorF family putative porin n=1 Tax=Herbaspirillum sp. RTI4 TaxID=3048640 RepID=UPI002AB3D8BF|nr:TorF family putative porin [Herbaspirillum sp. RTI4]MDY7577306.1 TorF family putative porin [Herbaspirillum sp. RTI4]MEA9982928.1 TorF family putative porin [Herbaspirillum sp. RTI4]
MKKLILVTAVAATLLGNVAYAEDAPVVAEAVPDNLVTYNIGVVNDYRFRGISQTRFNAALQGGADYVNNPTGLYVGTWLSNIQWIKDAVNAVPKQSGTGSIEWDLYAGKRGDIGGGFTYDVGGLYYYYPSNNYASSGGVNANTFELYGQVGYGPAYFKYSQALTNAFGNANSKNSGYYDLGANFDIGNNAIIGLHIGHQTIKGSVGTVGNSLYSYTDWKVGYTKTFEDFYGIALGVAYVGTDAKDAAYSVNPNKKNLGRDAIVFSLAKTF